MSTQEVAKFAQKSNSHWQLGLVRRARQGELGMLPVSVALGLIWLFFYIQFPIFLSARNLSFLLMQIAVTGILAVGMVLVLLLGEIDLSGAAAAGVCAAIVGVLLAQHNWSVVPAVATGFLAAIAIGLFQSFFVAVLRVPSFVVTLAGLLGLQGIMLVILGAQGTVNINDPVLLGIGTTYIPPVGGWALGFSVAVGYLIIVFGARRLRVAGGLPVTTLSSRILGALAIFAVAALAIWRLNQHQGVPLAGLLLLVAVAAWSLILRHTSFGRHVFAVGGNVEAAHRAGINVVRVRMTVMVLATLMFALGGVIGAGRFASVSYSAFAGGPLLLDAIGAAVIGGTSLFGGRGNVISALMGALVIGSLSNGLDLYNASSATKYIVSGAILLAAVTVDALSRRRRILSGAA